MLPAVLSSQQQQALAQAALEFVSALKPLSSHAGFEPVLQQSSCLPAGSLENDTYYCDYAIAPLNYFRANLTTVVGVPTAGECFITLCRWVDLGVRWC